MKVDFKIKLVVCLLIVLLTAGNFLIIGQNIVIAMYEELEEQKSKIENTNVSFDVSYENNSHNETINMTEGTNLIISINLENAGAIEDGKIYMNETNFKIVESELDKTYIKKIDSDNRIIELNAINSKNVRIVLPIEFEKNKEITTNYFDRINSFNFKCNYKLSESTIKEIEKEIKIRTHWVDDVDVEIEKDFSKYFSLGEMGVLLEQNIIVKDTNTLPKEKEILEIDVPIIEEQEPKDVQVLKNGNKIESRYENKKLTIENNKEKITFDENTSKYQIIYIYDTSIQVVKREIEFKGTINVKYFGKNEEITNTIDERIEVEEKGKVLNVEYKNTDSLNKGYLQYGSQYETNMEEEIKLEFITTLNKVEEIKLENNSFLTENENEYEVHNLYFRETNINKLEFFNIFDENAKLTVVNLDTSEILQEMNKDSQVDEEGNWKIEYPANAKHISLKIDGEISNVGTLKIINNKYFVGPTNYTKNQMLEMKKLKSNIQIISTVGVESLVAITELKDTYNNASIEVTPKVLSTVSKNENVLINATLLISDNENSLYVDPRIELILPTELKEIDIKSVYMLNTEELVVTKSYKTKNEIGQNVIIIETQGEVTEYMSNEMKGIEFVIEADITCLYEIENGEKEIVLNVTSREGKIETKTNCMLKAPTNIITASSIEKYNLEIINNEGNKEIKIDENAQEEQVMVKNTVVNANEENMNNVNVIGTLPTNNQKNNMGIKLLSSVQVNKTQDKNIKIYYTDNEDATLDINEERNAWKENLEEIENVKKYLVKVDNISKGEILDLSYEIGIPANLDYNKKALQGYTLSYQNSSEEINTINVDKLQIYTSTQAELEVELLSKVGLENVTEVKNGEIIHYTINAKNTGGKDAENVIIKSSIPAGTVLIEQREANANAEEFDDRFFVKYTDRKELEYVINIPKEESIQIDYEVLVLDSLQAGSEISSKVTSEYEGNKKESNTVIHNVQDSEIKIRLGMEAKENEFKIGFSYDFTLVIENTSNEDKTNVPLQILMDEELFEIDFINCGEVTAEGKNEIIIEKIPKNGYVYARVSGKIKKINEKADKTILLNAIIKENEKIYHSNSRKVVIRPIDIDVSMNSENAGKIIVPRCTVKYSISLINNLDYEVSGILVEDYISKSVEISEVKLGDENISETEWNMIEEDEFNVLSIDTELDANEASELTIIGIIDEDLDLEKNTRIVNKASVKINSEEIANDEVYHIIGESTSDSDDDPDNDNPDNDNPDNNPNIPGTYTISGIAWVDINEDGKKDSDDFLLEGIDVKLIDTNSFQTVVNGNNVNIETKTDENGIYVLTNIPVGQYIVIFEYNTQLYTTTQYRKEGVEETLNSDAIVRSLNINNEEKTVGTTEVISISDLNVENINIGLKYAQKFDLQLKKYVSNVIVKESNSEKLYNFNNTTLAKIEIDGKKVNNTQVIIQYVIRVSNIGELEGYVKSIVDYLPIECDLIQEGNEGWSREGEKLINTNLENQKILPGESKEIKLIVQKNMTEDNVGLISNIAEIESDYNESDISDYNSKPGNNNSSENDFGKAELMISIKTGGEIIIIGIVLIIVIAGVGIIIIKRRKKTYEEK